MTVWVGLLRGVNVGGSHLLPMRELVALLEGLGLRAVESYIQSGNVVFDGGRAAPATLAARIRGAIGERYGFEPQLQLLSLDDLERAVAANPFREAAAEPKTLHFAFLLAAPKAPDLAALEALRSPTERFELRERVFYLHAPDGIGKSKLVERLDRGLGVPTTVRNGRTVATLLEMARRRGRM